ncbi:bifunctional NAD(P)/FAD-dependent oxidoreductase/class I SAM-dependent methyltransferase [Microbacterium chocolatum]|uniref:bifunctional NAD(P)/FAD-dependent oxidoreductase/class I SAM-dependent methyltransferase n=1 Tax=Microbacterium aurantiacum TaxID=162393 RepID=UPI00338D371D
MHTWDALIVGSGPAGLAAALMLGRARRRVLVVDDDLPRNRFAAHMHAVVGFDGAPPADLTARGRAEAERYGVEFRSARVTGVADTTADRDAGLRVTITGGDTLTTRVLIAASGIVDELPAIPGLAEHWGTRVLHCPYCHGWEVRDERLGVLLTSPLGIHQADLVRQWSADLTVFSQGLALDDEARRRLEARGTRIVASPVTALTGAPGPLTGVTLADGTTVPLDALFVAAIPRPRDAYLDALDLPRDDEAPGRPIAADPMGRTAHPRVWIAGNVGSAFANVPLSLGQGSMAGAGANMTLVEDEIRAALGTDAADPTDPATHWEARYAERPAIWSGRVNAALADVVAPLPPGRALDLGCGEGGDAVWLARAGWQVTGLDISPTAVERARHAADGAGVGESTRFVATDLAEVAAFEPADLVLASFLHSTVDLPRTEILRRAAAAVVPGGRLLVIGHAEPPPWAGHYGRHAPMSTPSEDRAALALDPARWEVEIEELRERTATSPDGDAVTLRDGVLLLRRR